MTRPDPELLPLLATLLLPPGEAQRILAAGPPGPCATWDAAPRDEGREALLRRLARAAQPPWSDQRRRAAVAAARERPRLAELLQRVADGAAAPPGAAPFLLRLLRRRLASDGS